MSFHGLTHDVSTRMPEYLLTWWLDMVMVKYMITSNSAWWQGDGEDGDYGGGDQMMSCCDDKGDIHIIY